MGGGAERDGGREREIDPPLSIEPNTGLDLTTPVMKPRVGPLTDGAPQAATFQQLSPQGVLQNSNPSSAFVS